MLDASNDNGLTKMYPITVRILDINYSRVMTKFFDLNLKEGGSASTAAAMFSSVDKQFENFPVPWEYCLALITQIQILEITTPSNHVHYKKIVPL